MLHQQAFAYISSVGTGIVEFAHVDTLQLERGVVSNRVKQMDEGWVFCREFLLEESGREYQSSDHELTVVSIFEWMNGGRCIPAFSGGGKKLVFAIPMPNKFIRQRALSSFVCCYTR